MILMVFNWFKKQPIDVLGVDFGTSVVKLVELSKDNGQYRLESYAMAKIKSGDDNRRNVKELSAIVKTLMEEANVKTTRAYVAIPEAFVFSSIIDMPALPEKQLVQAIPYEARKYVPIPPEDVYLEWVVLPSQSPVEVSPEKKENDIVGEFQKDAGIQVLIIAVTRDIIDDFARIAADADLSVEGFEIENFSLIRAFLKNSKDLVVLVDVGAISMNVMIVDNGFMRLNYKQDLPALVNRGRSEFKKQINESVTQEIQRAMNVYRVKYGKSVKKCVLAGGGAFVEGLKDAVAGKTGLEILNMDVFSGIMYPAELKPAIEDIGPSFAVAVGLAMR